MAENFDDVENFDDLQKKVSSIVSDFTANLDSHIETAKQTGITKKDELMKIATEFYESHEKTLESAKTKAATFTGIPEEKIDTWIATAKKELTGAYSTIQSKFADIVVQETVKKSPTRKSPVKKSPANTTK